MAELLLNLRNVDDDEADEVRALLTEAGIDHYETEANRWGVSAGAIWLRRDADAARARALLDAYSAERRDRARALRERARRDGTFDTPWTVARCEPLRFALTLAGIVAVLALSAVPFVMLLH